MFLIMTLRRGRDDTQTTFLSTDSDKTQNVKTGSSPAPDLHNLTPSDFPQFGSLQNSLNGKILVAWKKQNTKSKSSNFCKVEIQKLVKYEESYKN